MHKFCICANYVYIYNVVILLPFKSCGNQAMPCLHFFHGSFYISTILREQWPMTKVWKFPLHPALQFGTDPGLKGWTYPSLWESDGERTNEFLLAIGDFERLDLLSACSLATTHCHAWSTVDICWHLLTSVDICWPYGRSTYYERITKVSVGFLCPALLIQRHQGGTTIRKSGTAKQHLIWPRHPRPQRIVAS